jgi:phenylpyruvate tautomerase PptA (4-oxalocrotonate tautomerase family)
MQARHETGADMPNIVINIPADAFAGSARAALVSRVNQAAAQAERISDDPKSRFLCWVVVNETAAGAFTCGGADVTAQLLPCMAIVYLPAGVLDDAARTAYVKLMHDAFHASLPAGDSRRLVTSVMLRDVADGTWGASGAIWKLPDFAKAAGFEHLQHLVQG